MPSKRKRKGEGTGLKRMVSISFEPQPSLFTGLGLTGNEDGPAPVGSVYPCYSEVVIERNRMINFNYDDYIHVSFANLEVDSYRENKFEVREAYLRYIRQTLTNGIEHRNKKFLFCGFSNSQLKSRTCFMHAADSHSCISEKINSHGDFAKINDVAQRSRRIALLFSSGDQFIGLPEHDFMEINDIEREGRIFTDGCGFISQKFAAEIARKYYIKFPPKRINADYDYVSKVLQIRYKGYKGILVARNDEEGNAPNVIFQRSMRKFDNSSSTEMIILDRSKPSGPAKLNNEIVSILSGLGIKDEVFLEKFRDHYDFIGRAKMTRDTAIAFMEYVGHGHGKVLRELAKQDPLLENLTPWIRDAITSSQREELKCSYNKKETERVHIMIPQSRLLYGVCDFSGRLKEGECFVRYTTAKKTRDRASVVGRIIVGRNPCLHLGDIQIFNAVREIPELEHLVDCIVFSTAGTLPAASQLSGGDLDGDKFFVCWDPDLIPEQCVPPLDYSQIQSNPSIPFRNENQQLDLIDYFTNYNTATIGKIISLYQEWLRVTLPIGAGSQECIKLNELYCRSVDGENVRIPKYLLHPPQVPWYQRKPFILETLTGKIRAVLGHRFQNIDNWIAMKDLMNRQLAKQQCKEKHVGETLTRKLPEVIITDSAQTFLFESLTQPPQAPDEKNLGHNRVKRSYQWLGFFVILVLTHFISWMWRNGLLSWTM